MLFRSTSATLHGFNCECQAYFLHYTTNGTSILTKYQGIEGVFVSSGSPQQTVDTLGWRCAFGQAILVGSIWEHRIKNVNATSGGHAIGSLNTGANYTGYIEQCILSGGDAAYYGCWQIIVFKNITITNGGRGGCRMVGCSSDFDYWFSGDRSGAETSIKLHKSEYGGSITMNNMLFDNEAGSGVTLAEIVIEAQHFSSNQLIINGAGFGNVSPGASLILLRDTLSGTGDYMTASSGNSGRFFSAKGIMLAGTSHDSIVELDGTLWNGLLDDPKCKSGGTQYIEKCAVISSTEALGRSNVKSVHNGFAMPPGGGTWIAGVSTLKVPFPLPGQFREYRCVRTGTNRTSSPSLWEGINPVDDGTGANAGYGWSNSYAIPITF